MRKSREKLVQELSEMESKVKDIQRRIASLDREQKPLINPVNGEYFILMSNSIHGDLIPSYQSGFNALGGVKFGDRKQAEDYAKAITTFVDLRRQKGTIPFSFDDVEEVYAIRAYKNSDNSICVASGRLNGSGVNSISPMFNTLSNANSALANIGADRLVHMFETFQNIEY